MSKYLLEMKRHAKAELPERLESIALNSRFNHERDMGSNQPQIHNFLNTRNREPTATRKEDENRNISYQTPLEVYQDKTETPRRGMTCESPSTASSDIPKMWLVQQSLPRMEVPKSNGNPIKWVEIVIKFKELVHD